MGNSWIPHFDSSSSSPCSTRPSSPAISRNNSNEGTHSGSRSAFSSCLNVASPYRKIFFIPPTLKIFSFAELKMATWDFSLHTLIAGGDFGQLFKGWIDEKTFAATKAGSGMAIAVKILNFDSSQDWEQWKSDVNLLGFPEGTRARPLGFCWEDGELLLVYKYTPGEASFWDLPDIFEIDLSQIVSAK